MSNPVLVEVTRGPLVESRHRGAVAVTDAAPRRSISKAQKPSMVPTSKHRIPDRSEGSR